MKDKSIRKIKFDSSEENVKEEIIFKDKIGRIRDIKQFNNKILILNDDGELWELKNKNSYM